MAHIGVRFVDKTGLRRFGNFTNNKLAALALKGAATKPLVFFVFIPESCPVVDRGAEGSIEMMVRQLKRQMRAVILELEKKIGMTFGNVDADFLRKCDCAIRFGRGAYGKTSSQLETDRRWSQHSFESEKVCSLICAQWVRLGCGPDSCVCCRDPSDCRVCSVAIPATVFVLVWTGRIGFLKGFLVSDGK